MGTIDHEAGDGREPLVRLVESARQAEADGWRELIDELSPLVRSVARRHRLQSHDADDVSQTVWLRLLENLDCIQQPQRLRGWISTTSTNECTNVWRRSRHITLLGDFPVDLEARRTHGPEPADDLAGSERGQVVRAALGEALRELNSRQRRLLFLLLEDPTPSYEEIGVELDMPVGSIGPTRARAVARLRRSRALAALMKSGSAPA